MDHPKQLDGSDHSDISSPQSSSGSCSCNSRSPKKSKRRQLFQRQSKSNSTSALILDGGSHRKLKLKLGSKRTLLLRQGKCHSTERVGATIINNKQDRGVLLEELHGSIRRNSNSVHSAASSRFSAGSLLSRESQAPTITRRNSINANNHNHNKTIPNNHHHHHNHTKNKKSASTIVHTCDNKGRCLFHPHIQLRRKSILGLLGGWKDLHTKCPDCERQELQQRVLREKMEIQQLEMLLGRLDQHDVEYLNDDGVDEEGNYLRRISLSEDQEGGGEEEGMDGDCGNGNDGGGKGKRVVQITFEEGCRLPVVRRKSSLF